MQLGNAPYDGGHLILTADEANEIGLNQSDQHRWLRDLWGSTEVINGNARKCIWIEDEALAEAVSNPIIRARIESVKKMRSASTDAGTRAMSNRPHQFREMYDGKKTTLIVPIRDRKSTRLNSSH